MALEMERLEGVAESARELFEEIGNLRRAGEDEATDEIERRALELVTRLEVALEAGMETGEADVAEVRAALEAQKRALSARLGLPDLGLSEEMAVLTQIGDIDFKLFALEIEGTLTWDRLLTDEELERYRGALREAANQVRRRKKLQSIARSVFAVFSIGLGLVSKIVAP